MKIKNIASIAALIAVSLFTANAANTTLTAWTFDNNGLGSNISPTPSTGLGAAASVVAPYAPGNQTIVSLSGSSTISQPYSWQLQSGWSTNAPLGSQGAQFAGSTAGYYQVQVSFDVNATADAEAYLQVQYTTEGTIWHNATITSVGTGATIYNNSSTSNSLVVGSYCKLASGWNNQIKVSLVGVSGVDNCAAFAIRVVNAATGTNCLTTTGAHYNNTSGSWAFDNVVIQGVSYDTIADWTFDNLSSLPAPVNNPTPAISNNTATAAIIGFNLPSYVFADGSVGSTNYADIPKNGVPYSSTGSAGQYVWRLRGQNPGNGWNTAAPIGSQGAEFDVSTLNYSNVVLTFDLYQTSQGEAKMCVLYTTDGWVTTNIANNISYGANPTLIVSNSAANPLDLPGTYFFNTFGSIFFNNLIVDFTGDHTVENNPNFGIRIVNAATGSECVNYLGQPYNNASGNSRLDNVAINGQYEGLFAPVVTNAPVATVDSPFTNTFAVNAAWALNINSIYVNGLLVPSSAYTITYSNIVFNPANSTALQVSGLDSFVIYANGFTTAKYNQFVATGKAVKLTLTQPAAPSTSGGTLTLQPMEAVTDQYGNGTTNPYASMYVVASVSNSVAWTLGGSTTQPIVNGYCVFSNLTATVAGSTKVTGAAIQFTIYNYTNTATNGTTATNYSSTFTIGVPPVPFTLGNLAAIQSDTVSNNTTFSIIELQPSTAGQSKPVNIVPISATGANALRMSPSGSGGHLTLSDDGTFLCFAAYQDGSSVTPDETFNLNRAVGIISNNLAFGIPVSYVSSSFGGSQARAACSPDNQNFIIDDKGGLYVNNTLVYAQNNISVKSFGGATWALTAKVPYPPQPSMFQFVNGGANPLPPDAIDWSDPGDNGPKVVTSLTPPSDPVAQDFYLIATNGAYNIAYILDQNGGIGGTNTVISKWVFNSDPAVLVWSNVGRWTNIDNGDSLFATTNGVGGVYLFYANGGGAKSGNSIVRLTDQNVAGSLNIISTNVIYTAPSGTTVEGVTFVPQTTSYGTELTPPPVLTTQLVSTNGYPTFALGLASDDGIWRSNITSITVNGNLLPTTAYNTNQAGMLVFDPAQYAPFKTVSTNLIVISATGYSTNSITQVIGGVAAKLLVTTQPKAPPTNNYALATQPVVTVVDAGGNPVSSTAVITATPVQVTWTFSSGATTVSANASTGAAVFSGLTPNNSTPTNPIPVATISFSSPGLTSATNTAFIIPGIPPAITPAASPTVDSPFVVTFTDNSAWRAVITNVTVNGSALTNTAYTVASGQITFNPALSKLLQTNGTDTISVLSSNYNASIFTQTIGAGVAAKLIIINQPLDPLADGGVLTHQPVVTVNDQYNNLISTTATITAAPGQSTWTLGGTTNVAAVAGTSTYAGLTAFSTNSVSGVTIVFSSGSLSTTSLPFNIPAPIISTLSGVNLSGGKLAFSFTNAAGLSFSVHATNNITIPKPWPVVGAPVESPAGTYNFTDPNGATNAQLFYYLSQP